MIGGEEMNKSDYDNFKGYIKCILFGEGINSEDYREMALRLHEAIESGVSELCEEQGIKDYEGWRYEKSFC